jgi:APA family basic amino acid/polyamine antiporter
MVNVPLKRILGLGSTVMFVVGTMIGTGVFKKIAPMAATGMNETWIITAWVVAGVFTLMGALSISALAELTNDSGGEYEYLRIIFGNFPAFVFGWTSFTIIGSASAAAMSYLFIESIRDIFHFQWLDQPLFFKSMTCLSIVMLSLFNILGTRESTNMNNVLTYLKITGVAALIIGAFFFAPGQSSSLQNTDNSTGISHVANTSGIFFMMMLSAFWAYDGWLNISFMSGEIKDPGKNVPKAIIGGITLVMMLYVFINLAYMRVLSLPQLAAYNENGIAASGVSERIFGSSGNLIIASLIMFSALGSLNGNIITYSRMYYKMGIDGLFFKKAAVVNQKFRTPHWSLLLSMVMSCLLVFTGSFDQLTNMIVFAGFLFYALLAFGVIIFRRQGKIKARGIGYPVTPVLFIVFSIVLLIHAFMEMPEESVLGIMLMSSAIPVYFLFKKRAGS